MSNDGGGKLEQFLRNKYNLVFLGIILFAFILRLFYYNINSALWWDEATYLDSAKYWAFGQPYWNVEAARPPFFMLLGALFFKLGLGETGVRFFTVLIPSVGVVVLTFILGKKLYNIKIGLIASFIMSVFWVLLFNTGRVHTDALAALLTLLAVYYFWKAFILENGKYKVLYAILTGLFLGLGYLTRLPLVITLFIMLLYLFIIKKGFKFLSDKKFWYSAIAFFVVIVPYSIWGIFHYGRFLPWLTQYSEGATGNVASLPIAWDLFSYFSLLNEKIFFILFLLGLLTLINLFVGFDLIWKKGFKMIKSDLFSVFMIVITFLVYVFIFRGAEPRYMLPFAAFMFFIIAKGLMLIYKYLTKYNKYLALVIVLILLFGGAYYQLQHTNFIVNLKKDSYIQYRLAGEWIKDNTDENDVVVSAGTPELTYYSERRNYGYSSKEEDFEEWLIDKNPKYVVLSVIEKASDWAYDYVPNHPELLKPVQAYFFDVERTQPILIVYEYIGYRNE